MTVFVVVWLVWNTVSPEDLARSTNVRTFIFLTLMLSACRPRTPRR